MLFLIRAVCPRPRLVIFQTQPSTAHAAIDAALPNQDAWILSNPSGRSLPWHHLRCIRFLLAIPYRELVLSCLHLFLLSSFSSQHAALWFPVSKGGRRQPPCQTLKPLSTIRPALSKHSVLDVRVGAESRRGCVSRTKVPHRNT